MKRPCVEALEGSQDHLETWRRDCDWLRHEVAGHLNQVAGVHCPLPEGATFVFPRCDGTLSSAELATLLVEQEGVVVTPGVGFGECGVGHFRIALMRSPAGRVVEGAQRIARALAEL